MPRRINHSESRKLILKSFKDSKSSHKVFHDNWEVQLFAAALAFQRNKTSVFTDVDSGSGIDFTSFGGSYKWPGFMNAMALVKEGKPDILNSDAEESRIATFEQYADAGFDILNEDAVLDMNVIQLADYILDIN